MNHTGVRKGKDGIQRGQEENANNSGRRAARRSAPGSLHRDERAGGQTGVVPTSALTNCDTTGRLKYPAARSYSTDDKLMFTRRIWSTILLNLLKARLAIYRKATYRKRRRYTQSEHMTALITNKSASSYEASDFYAAPATRYSNIFPRQDIETFSARL